MSLNIHTFFCPFDNINNLYNIHCLSVTNTEVLELLTICPKQGSTANIIFLDFFDSGIFHGILLLIYNEKLFDMIRIPIFDSWWKLGGDDYG